MRRVINGTGVILHTNLGRALLGQSVKAAVSEAMDHYVSLEVELTTGQRSRRGETMLELIRLATEAESALVVNNCAAAVYLVVDSFSPPGRVIVSRGELVEIGGSFRLPDILERAAGEVIEVGTTNRTYDHDYAKAARPGDILMKAHRSNYDIHGFTHEASLGELVDVAKEKGCHVVYDLGSGSFFDFAGAGFEGEEHVRNILRSGVDCVMFSGDKLLGGAQAGILAGRTHFMNKLRENPLRRAFRVDKMTVAAVQAVFRVYLFGKHPDREVPVLAQSTETVDDLRQRAERVVTALSDVVRRASAIEVVDDVAAIGGGSFAGREIPSAAIAVRCSSEKEAVALAKRMRGGPIPIIGRIKGNEVRINMRSVMPYEEEDLRRVLRSVLATNSSAAVSATRDK
jgi:L-seryl-tRNA(Ser) seleniumtransferase